MNPFAIFTLLLPLVAPTPRPDAAPFVDLLGSRSHTQRVCAEHVLRTMGQSAEGNLEWAWRCHPCPSVRRHSERLLIDLDWLAYAPWIDFPEGPERWPLMTGYLWQARECGAVGGPPDWSDYREATARLMRDLRRCRVSAANRAEMLAYMQGREAAWWASRLHPLPTLR